MVYVWWFDYSSNEAMSNAGSIYFHNQPPEPNDTFSFAVTPDGVQNGYLFFWSALTNGRGKHLDTAKYPYIKSG